MIGPDDRQRTIRHVIGIGAGKGGVGKSTVALNLALSLRALGRVGLLDFDFYAPNIPLMLGLVRTAWTEQWTLARRGRNVRFDPVEVEGMRVVSSGFVLGEDQSMGLDSMAIRFMANQLINQVNWGDLDFLVVDLPPGTSAVQHVLLKESRLDGAILVVTPQDVAHLDAKKAATMLRTLGVAILGGVENMAAFKCPSCGSTTELFAPVSPARSLWAAGVAKLASLPFAEELRLGGTRPPGSPVSQAFDALAPRVVEALEARQGS